MMGLRNLLRALFRHDAMNREMSQEMRDHLERATQRLMARGMARVEAEALARREFGNAAVLAEEGRDARGAGWVERLRGDIRYGVRSLRRSPTYTLVAILSLAVGIGANTAVFSLINAVLLRPLPVFQPEELLQLGLRDSIPANPDSKGAAYFTNPLWEAVKDRTSQYATYAVSDNTGFSLVSGGELRSARGLWINGDFFTTLGVRPLIGRLITAADDRPGCAATVVLGEAFWRSEFGGAPDAIGRSMRLEGKPFTIIGVVPRSFFGVDVGSVQQVYAPLCAEPVIRGPSSALGNKSDWWLRVIARPRHGVSAAMLEERLRALSHPIMVVATPDRLNSERKAEFASRKLHVTPAFLGLSSVRAQYASALKILMGMVGLILLIGCANVANLSLARGAARTRELAVRIAIGASRGRVVRQLLTEATLLALAGTLAGVVIAGWATRSLVGLMGTSRNEVMLDLTPDLRVLAFAVVACMTTVILFGLIPAWRAARVDPQIALKAGGRGTAEGHSRFRLGKALVVGQSALAFILVVGAALLVTTFARLTTSPLGFEPDGVLLARVRVSGTSIPATQRNAVIERIRAGIAALPTVQSVSTLDVAPIGDNTWNDAVVVEGDAATSARPPVIWFNAVGDEYFRTMQTRLLSGRAFGSGDTPASARVAVVNEAAVRQLFGGTSPIGRAFRVQMMGQAGERTTIVGVVENARYQSVRDAGEPIIYLAQRQDTSPRSGAQFAIRAGTAIPSVIGSVKAIAGSIDPQILLMFTRLDEQVSRSLQREKALAVLSGFFGALALALAMIGLYGMMAYSVSRRRVEIGIRVALGAARGRVFRLVLGDVALLIGAGIAIGGAATYASVKVLQSLLYGIEPRDPITLAGAAVLLALAALLAGALPARRAASLQPVEALRED